MLHCICGVYKFVFIVIEYCLDECYDFVCDTSMSISIIHKMMWAWSDPRCWISYCMTCCFMFPNKWCDDKRSCINMLTLEWNNMTHSTRQSFQFDICNLTYVICIWGATESNKAAEGGHRAASQGQEGKRVWEVWPWPEGTGAEGCWMPISGGRGWWSTIEVPQGNRASETGSKHHPHARARWHSRPQSSICKYPSSLSSKPFLAKIHMLVRFCRVTFSVCDTFVMRHLCNTFAMRFTCLWNSVESPSLFAIPLRCDAFAIPLRWELHRKDRYMAFWHFG